MRRHAVDRRRVRGTVYSLEVLTQPRWYHAFGLVAHNCFPKDSRALVHIAEDAGYDFDLLKGVIDGQRGAVRPRGRQGRPDGRRLASRARSPCGVSRSRPAPTTSATRPSLEIIRRLSQRGRDGARPTTRRSRRRWPTSGHRGRADPYAACEGAEVLAVLTEWDEFRWLDLDKVAEHGRAARRRRPQPARPRRAALAAGSTYQGIGRS